MGREEGVALPGVLMEKPSKPGAWAEPGSPLLCSQQQEDPLPQQWGRAPDQAGQLALKELQDFPKDRRIDSQVGPVLRGNQFFSVPYIDESSC